MITDGDDHNKVGMILNTNREEEIQQEQQLDIKDKEKEKEEEEYDLNGADIEFKKDLKEEEEKATPLPLLKLFAIFIIMLCDAINAVSIFSYINFMIADFNLTDNKKMLGYYVGVLGSSYYASQLFSSFFWGWFSNKYGRRPAVLCGLIGSIISLFGFGLSKHYILSIFFRFTSGLLNGNVSVAKTMLGEITDSSNQAKAFSFIGLSWSIGGIVAPLIGGFTSNICRLERLRMNPNGLFCKFPYFLPNLICIGFSVTGLILAYFYLQESITFTIKPRKSSKKNTIPGSGSIFISLIKNIKKILSIFGIVAFNNVHEQLVDIKEPSKQQKEQEEDYSDNLPIIMIAEEEEEEEEEDEEDEDYSNNPRPVLELLKDRPVISACFIYAFLGFMFNIFEESFPVYASTTRVYNPDTGELEGGGYGFTSAHIGFLQSCSGTFALFIQSVILPSLLRKIGLVKAFKISMIIILPSWILLPELSRLTILQYGESQVEYPTMFWILLFPAYMFQAFAGEVSFIAIIVMISNSCLPKDMALVNSIAMFLVSISRTLGPITGSSVLAFTLSHSFPYPLDFRFVFILEFILCIILLVLSHIYLPNSLNQTKEKSIVLVNMNLNNTVDDAFKDQI